jgi:pimeloyl-ACP methyl ester carboxylesterase
MAQNPHLTPHLIQNPAGKAIPAEWGRIQVPENRGNPNASLIEVSFVRVCCQRPNPEPPVFLLPGGPGFPILDKLPGLASLYSIPETIADLIVVEQRGVGQSRPSLDCPGTYDLPLDEPTSYESALAAHRGYIWEAVEFWKDRGVDLQGYNVGEMAADIDSLRRALGYDKIQLVGGSFGSHHSLAVLRSFGDFVARAFLWGIEGPDHTIKRPQNIQAILEVLDGYLKADPYWGNKVPDLRDLMAGVLEFIDRYPVTWEVKHSNSGKIQQVVMGKYDLQWITAGGLGNMNFIRALPARYFAMSQGDYSWLAEAVLEERLGIQSNLTYELVDYASGATPARRAQIKSEVDSSLLGDVINGTLFDLGDELGNPDVGEVYRSSLDSEVPVLLGAGELDARTPPTNAREVIKSLLNGQLLEISGASHDLTHRGEHVPAYNKLRDRFLAGEDLETTHLASAFKFSTLEEQ